MVLEPAVHAHPLHHIHSTVVRTVHVPSSATAARHPAVYGRLSRHATLAHLGASGPRAYGHGWCTSWAGPARPRGSPWSLPLSGVAHTLLRQPARVDAPSSRRSTRSPGLTKSLWRGTFCLVCVAHEDFAGDGFFLPTLPQQTLRWLAHVQAHPEQIWTTYFAVTRCITSMLLVLRDLRHLNNRCPQRHRHG